MFERLLELLLFCRNENPVFDNNLIENGVTDTEDVDYNGVFQQRQQVVGHSLPEMEQKILDLKQNIWRAISVWEDISFSGFTLFGGVRNDHLLKVDINGIVQDALAVRFIHHDQSVHLQREHEDLIYEINSQTNNNETRYRQPIEQLLSM